MSLVRELSRIRSVSLLCLPLLAAAIPLGAQDWLTSQGVLAVNPSYVQRLPAVAVTADGHTAYVSTTCYSGCDTGTVRIYTRSNGEWTESASLNAGTMPHGELGWALDASADGNTLIVGAQADYLAGTPAPGAAVIWFRSGGTWTRQALLSGGNTAVAVSGDGNTALVGGAARLAPSGPNEVGTWVYVRAGSSWIRQAKLTDSTADAELSGDGNTAIVGGAIFVRSGGAWTQQAALPITGGLVSLSADGNTALYGAGVFSRATGTWVQTEAFPSEYQGVAMSPGGTTIFIASDEVLVALRSAGEDWELLGEFDLEPPGASVAVSFDGRTAIVGLLEGSMVLVQPVPVDLTMSAFLVGNQTTVNVKVTSSNPRHSGPPSGVVGLMDDTGIISAALVDADGEATLVATLDPGPHSIRVLFIPLMPFMQYQFSDTVQLSVRAIGVGPVSTLALEIFPATPTVGQTITFLATVSTEHGRTPPTGRVRFFERNTLLGTGSVINGQARFLTTLPKGAHSVTAVYEGDGTYPGAAAAPVGFTVSRLPLVWNLRSSPSSAAYGQALTFTATFATAQAPQGVPLPSGTVQFYAGSAGFFGMMADRRLLGEAKIANGAAVLTVTSLPAGQQQVIAVYLGDENWSNGSSNALALEW